ncbi:MAG: hypothetical protein R3B93_14705 [Bacteroidia bacterium]
MKNLFLLPTLLFLVLNQVFSQNFEIPKDYSLETASDYEKYEKSIVAAVDWLTEAPVNSNESHRKEVNAFLMKWLTGSPSVSIALTTEIATFMDCGDCLLVYMGGWAKYVIETGDNDDKVKANLAGLESVMTFYQKHKSELGKNKAIEKYIKMKAKGKLEAFVESKV